MDRRTLLAGAGTIGTSVVAGCFEALSRTGRPPPPTDRRDSHSSGSDTPTDESRGVSIRWQAEIGKRIPVPAVEDGSVYAVGSTSGVHAFATDDGTRRWHRSSPRSAWFGPAVSDGVVYAVDYWTLVAYDAANGEERWRHTWPKEAGMEASPVVGEDAVFAGISSVPTSHTDSKFPEDLWAFDRRDGSLLWKRDLSGGTRPNLRGPLTGLPILHDETLYVLAQDGEVFALDPSDGSERWHRQFDVALMRGWPTLVAERELLVVAIEAGDQEPSSEGALVALATGDGRERWRVEGIRRAPVSDGTTVFGGDVPFHGGPSTVFALSADDGSEQWQFERPGRLNRLSSPSEAGGTLFASFTELTGRGDVKDDDSTLYAVGSDGTEQWRLKRSCEGFSRAAVSEGTVFVAGRFGDGTLYALAPET